MDYSTMILQTSTSTVEGLLYSSAKRPLLAESERSRTPIKIQKFTHTSDGCKVIVNDMTKISKPEQTEYSFQFTDVPTVPAAEMVSVKDIMEAPSNEGELVSVRGKIIHVNSPSLVTANQLQIASAVLADATGTITLDLWQQHISAVQVGHVYNISPVQIRRWQGKKKISTVTRTAISVDDQADAVAQIQIDANIDEQHDQPSARTLQVQNIYAIETVETHLQCVKCSRKILQAAGLVVHCDRCGYTMRTSNCPKRRFAAIVVKAEGNLLYLKVFDSVLQAFFPNYDNMADVQVAEELLLADNISLTYDPESRTATAMALQVDTNEA